MIFAVFVVLVHCASALSLSSLSSTSQHISGVVDAYAKVDGGVICVLDNEPCDVMLSLQDPVRNIDRFYVLQLIEHNACFTVLTKWGRTGQNGTPRTYELTQFEAAVHLFRKKYQQKTGLVWEARRAPLKPGRYRTVWQNYIEKQHNYTSGSWEYCVDDGVDGETDGWCEYTQSDSQLVEQLYQEHLLNRKFCQRWVKSGRFTYNIDLGLLEQTNVEHPNRKRRRIRRVVSTNALVKDDDEERRRLDPDVSRLALQSISHLRVVRSDGGVWYDAVLNKCDIGANSNKHYKLQLLTNSTHYYGWYKWGRVGVPCSGGKLAGPYASLDAATQQFQRKYKHKTGRMFGEPTTLDAAVAGKYVNVQVETMASISNGPIPPIDVPLGIPSLHQVQQGMKILEAIDEKLSRRIGPDSLVDLSSQFYTTIPHSFGWKRPPSISTTNDLQLRYDLCNALIEHLHSKSLGNAT